MKKIIVIVTLFLGNILYGQRSLTSSEAKDLNVSSMFKNGEKISEFILNDGSVIKIGSELIIGKPRNPLSLNYDNIRVGYVTLTSEIISPSVPLQGNYEGNPVIVETMKVYHRKATKASELQIYIFAYNDSQTSLTGDKYRTITDLEYAISGGEIVNPNAAMTREQAIAKLKESKDLLDLGLLTQDGYDKIKAELTPIIMGSK
jgi:hypothetical protein